VAPAGTTAVALVVVAFVGVTRVDVLKRTPVTVALKVPLIVTVEPTMPLVGEGVGAPGQAAAPPVVNVKSAEFPPVPPVLCTETVVEVLTANEPPATGRPTSACVSASVETSVPPTSELWWNVTVLSGPPFSW
jgi:hypothetical protein